MSNDKQQAREYLNRGQRRYEDGDLAGACRDLARGIVHSERAGQPAPDAARALLGRAYCLVGKFEQARTFARQDVTENSLAEALDWIQGRPVAAPEPEDGPPALMVGYGAALAGRFEVALACLSRVRRGEPAGSPFLSFSSTGWMGVIALRTGHVDRAATYLGRAVRLAAEHPGLTTHLPIFQAARAELVLGGGNVTAAVRLAEEALDLAERSQQPLAQALCQHTLARIVPVAPNPDWQAAAEMIQETMLYFQREKAAPLLAIAGYENGLLQAAHGETTAAREALEESKERFSALEMTWYRMQAQMALASLAP